MKTDGPGVCHLRQITATAGHLHKMADPMVHEVAAAKQQMWLSSAASAAVADSLQQTQMALGPVASSITSVPVWLVGAIYFMHQLSYSNISFITAY